MCIAASTAAEDFCFLLPLPRTTHRLLPFSEPFGATAHHTRPVCACVRVWVRACGYRTRWRSTTEKRGSARLS